MENIVHNFDLEQKILVCLTVKHKDSHINDLVFWNNLPNGIDDYILTPLIESTFGQDLTTLVYESDPSVIIPQPQHYFLFGDYTGDTSGALVRDRMGHGNLTGDALLLQISSIPME